MKGGDDAAKAAVKGAAWVKNAAAAGNLLRVKGVNDEAERSSWEECRRNRDDDGNRSNILSLAIGMHRYRCRNRGLLVLEWIFVAEAKTTDIHVAGYTHSFGGKLRETEHPFHVEIFIINTTISHLSLHSLRLVGWCEQDHSEESNKSKRSLLFINSCNDFNSLFCRLCFMQLLRHVQPVDYIEKLSLVLLLDQQRQYIVDNSQPSFSLTCCWCWAGIWHRVVDFF